MVARRGGARGKGGVMASAVNVLLVGEKQAMARVRRWIRRALPSFRLTVASDPASWTASLKKKDIGLALVQRPLGWRGEPQVERRIKERWPGCVLLWLGTTGIRHDLGAALQADVDGMLADSAALEEDLAFHLQLALARGADRAALRRFGGRGHCPPGLSPRRHGAPQAGGRDPGQRRAVPRPGAECQRCDRGDQCRRGVPVPDAVRRDAPWVPAG